MAASFVRSRRRSRVTAMMRATALTLATLAAASSMAAPSMATEGAAVPVTRWDKAPVPASYPERTLGKADAPVTIIEYSSLTCPHCAAFHAQILPKVKSELIDTGKVRLVFRDFPLDRLAMAGALVARCVPEPVYFKMIDVLFATQRGWASADKPMDALKQNALLAGANSDALNACVNSPQLLKDVQAVRGAAADQYHIDSTPSFVINGTVHPGLSSYDELADLVAKASH